MAETKMNVKLLAHTQLTGDFINETFALKHGNTDGQAVALTAIRTCYSPLKPSEIVATEGEKYFGNTATDGEGGTEADRLFRHITRSGHTSTLEHLSYTFAVEGVSRALLAQLTRHRVGFSFSVQSQRYVKFGSGDKSGGFDYVVPDSVKNCGKRISIFDDHSHSAEEAFEEAMRYIQQAYNTLRSVGIPSEDARAVLPNATACNLTMTANLRSLLEFYKKRQHGRGAQNEVAQLAVELKNAVIAVDPWTKSYFDAV